MRILIISHAYVERDNHRKLAELSVVAGLEIGVVYPSFWRTWHGEEKRKQRVESEEQRVYGEFPLPVFFAGDGGRYFYDLGRLFSLIRRFKPDLIHLEEEPFTPVAFEVALVSKWLRKKLIFFSWENLDLPLGWWRSLLERFVFSVSSSALVGNREAQDRLGRRGFVGPLQIIPQFGVDTDLFRSVDRLPAAAEVLTVGFVGRLSLAKGVGTLFKAVSLAGSKFNLLVVTSSPKVPEEVINLAKLAGVWSRTRFEVSVPHSQLPAFYSLMSVFVLPSRTTATWKEQFGRTIVEAMACGVPVIGSNSGAIPELVGGVGLIFQEGDEKALARSLVKLAGDPQLREDLRRRGLALVNEKYSFEKLAQETANFYRSL